MNITEAHKLISKYYVKPVFKQWQPSAYDMKWHYNTPRRLKRLDADRVKENAKLQRVFDKALTDWQKCHDTVDEIGTWPAEIRDLFLDTIEWTVNDITHQHEYVLAAEDEFKATYGEYGFRYVNDLRHLSERHSYQFRRNVIVSHDVTEDEWKCFVKSRGVYVDGKGYVYPLESVTDWKTYISDAAGLREMWKNDAVHNEGQNAYVNAIKHMSDALTRICADIRRFFNGDKPTACVTDPHWGDAGKFNGILTDGTTQISFKSFGAGGIPGGVQRFHYRFKCTKLKN